MRRRCSPSRVVSRSLATTIGPVSPARRVRAPATTRNDPDVQGDRSPHRRLPRRPAHRRSRVAAHGRPDDDSLIVRGDGRGARGRAAHGASRTRLRPSNRALSDCPHRTSRDERAVRDDRHFDDALAVRGQSVPGSPLSAGSRRAPTRPAPALRGWAGCGLTAWHRARQPDIALKTTPVVERLLDDAVVVAGCVGLPGRPMRGAAAGSAFEEVFE